MTSAANAPIATSSFYEHLSCAQCAQGEGLGFAFSMAFQPIVDVASGEVFAHEALARGTSGEPAATVFAQVNDANRYRFDQACRVKAVALASRLDMRSLLSINFMPNAVYRPELCIRTTLEAAAEYGFPSDRILFEFTEGEPVPNVGHLRNIVNHYKAIGFKTAIDDFGAGYAGLNLLADLQPDFVKLDMELIRGIDKDHPRRAIAKAVVTLCRELDIQPIAEGVETAEELRALRDLDISLFQGYYFARPAFEALAPVNPADWRL